ncbi:hypothetical protein LCGC14_1861520 [marine sediment metagenome]|uniref:Resolvase/invertase-type recombinase catalytic domain-containing protein n=1 Tax=marine sediment metagenome TaxID=412755 RepID=A0A0F9J6H0_9ZZZZ
MKVAIYCRVSRTDQNLANQVNPLTEYCKRMGYEFEIFTEKESTRKTRPVQWGLYNRLLRKEFDGLIIYKFDRWARSTKELIEHMERLVEKGVLVYSYTENLDLNSSMGKAMLTIISAFAQLERDIIRERTMAGLDRARAQGKKLGRPRKGKERPKPPIDKVAELYLKGHSIRDMAKELGSTKYWIEWSLKEMKENPNKVGAPFREGVFNPK